MESERKREEKEKDFNKGSNHNNSVRGLGTHKRLQS